VLAAPGPALRGPPLLGFGGGVLNADPPGRLLVAFLFPAGSLLGWRVLAGFFRRGADLGGEVAGQALIAGIGLGLDAGMAAEQVFDPAGAQRSDIVSTCTP
jgi:hypothetical protein